MAKENKNKLIIWASVALVIGIIIGLLIPNLTTMGQAKSALGLDPENNKIDFEEAGRDLVLNSLKVNTIYNRQNPTDGSNIDMKSNEINLISNELKIFRPNFTDTTQPTVWIAEEDSQPKIGVSAPVVFTKNIELSGNDNLLIASEIVSNTELVLDAPQVDISGDEKIQLNTAGSIINMYDSINGPIMSLGSHWLNLTGNHIGIGNNQSTAISINPSGDIQLQNLSSGHYLDYNGLETAYACLTADGTLFRSLTPCN